MGSCSCRGLWVASPGSFLSLLPGHHDRSSSLYPTLPPHGQKSNRQSGYGLKWPVFTSGSSPGYSAVAEESWLLRRDRLTSSETGGPASLRQLVLGPRRGLVTAESPSPQQKPGYSGHPAGVSLLSIRLMILFRGEAAHGGQEWYETYYKAKSSGPLCLRAVQRVPMSPLVVLIQAAQSVVLLPCM